MTVLGTQDVDALGAALWLLVAEAGHHGCRGWTVEERDGLLECACGTVLYQLREVDRRAGGRPGAVRADAAG
jgi:hypothetical protein